VRGDRLKALRIERGLTQEELADAVGVHRGAIANYETGRRDPEALVLLRLAKYFNVSSEYLMGLTDDPRRNKNLPPGWEQVLAKAAQHHMSPDEVTRLIEQVGEMIRRRSQD